MTGPILYAHRGASFELPENTLEAFGLALELGADAIETDAHLTRDGRVVLSHDPTGHRAAGIARPIADATLSEIQAWDLGAAFTPRRPGSFRRGKRYRMPTLEEALAAFPDVVFNVDAKPSAEAMVPALVRVIRASGAEGRVAIASFSYRNVARARRLGYRGDTGLSTLEVIATCLGRVPWRVPPPGAAKSRGTLAQLPREAYGYRFDRREVIARLHARGLRVHFWTIDDPDDAERLVALGADGIMTDDPRAYAQRSSWKSGSRFRT